MIWARGALWPDCGERAKKKNTYKFQMLCKHTPIYSLLCYFIVLSILPIPYYFQVRCHFGSFFWFLEFCAVHTVTKPSLGAPSLADHIWPARRRAVFLEEAWEPLVPSENLDSGADPKWADWRHRFSQWKKYWKMRASQISLRIRKSHQILGRGFKRSLCPSVQLACNWEHRLCSIINILPFLI